MKEVFYVYREAPVSECKCPTCEHVTNVITEDEYFTGKGWSKQASDALLMTERVADELAYKLKSAIGSRDIGEV